MGHAHLSLSHRLCLMRAILFRVSIWTFRNPSHSHERNTLRMKFMQSLSSFPDHVNTIFGIRVQLSKLNCIPSPTPPLPEALFCLVKTLYCPLTFCGSVNVTGSLGMPVGYPSLQKSKLVVPCPNPVVLHYQNFLFIHYSVIYIVSLCLSCLPPTLDCSREKSQGFNTQNE